MTDLDDRVKFYVPVSWMDLLKIRALQGLFLKCGVKVIDLIGPHGAVKRRGHYIGFYDNYVLYGINSRGETVLWSEKPNQTPTIMHYTDAILHLKGIVREKEESNDG